MPRSKSRAEPAFVAEALRGLSGRADRRPRHQGHHRTLSPLHQPRRIPPLLRQDNCDLRLTEKAAADRSCRRFPTPAHARQGDRLARTESALRRSQSKRVKIEHWLKRPENDWTGLLPRNCAEISATKSGASPRPTSNTPATSPARRTRSPVWPNWKTLLPSWLEYSEIRGLKAEARVKLASIKPATFGQAARIEGVTPADLAVLAVWVRGGEPNQRSVIRIIILIQSIFIYNFPYIEFAGILRAARAPRITLNVSVWITISESSKAS